MNQFLGKRITVYCAGSTKIAPKYFEAADIIAHDLVSSQATLVFGGGKTGLMGHIATQVISLGGTVQGIMPHMLREIEMNHPLVEDFLFVETMAERKALLLSNTIGLIALPGGSGTLDELIEAITLKRLGQYLEPIVVVNIDGFYDPLIALIDRMVSEEFMLPEHRELWTIVNNPADAVRAIATTPRWDNRAIHRALVK